MIVRNKTFVPALFLVALLFAATCTFPEKGMFNFSGDVGNCKRSGSVFLIPSTGTYLLTGAGTNMWHQSDEFFMAWREVSGDFSLSAEIGFIGKGVDAHRKLGLIIRESQDANARYADVCVHGDGLTSLQYRKEVGDMTDEVKWSEMGADHIVLERKGNKIIMKTAVGKYPEEITGSIELNLPESCYVGLFVCSHNPDVLETAYFTNIQFKN